MRNNPETKERGTKYRNPVKEAKGAHRWQPPGDYDGDTPG